MKRARDADRLLGQARADIEPSSADAARVRQKLAERLSDESGVHRNEPHGEAGAGPLGSGRGVRAWSPGVSQLAIVGLVAGVTGFLLGRAFDGEHEGRAAPSPRERAPVALPEAAGVPSGAAIAPERTNVSDLAVLDTAFSDRMTPDVAETARPTLAASEEVLPKPARRRTSPQRAASRPPPSADPPHTSSVETPGATTGAERDAALGLRAALDLIRRAEAERQAGRPESALQLLAELEARAPDLLAEERLMTAVLSECDLGNTSRARSLARDVSQANRSSIYARRLRASCAADGPRPK
jgi:hypothetical protein